MNSYIVYADMAELADAPDLGSGVTDVQVQVLLSALEATNVENTAFVAFFCLLIREYILIKFIVLAATVKISI